MVQGDRIRRLLVTFVGVSIYTYHAAKSGARPMELLSHTYLYPLAQRRGFYE